MKRESDRRTGAVSVVMRFAVSVYRGEKGTKPKGGALDLPVDLSSYTLTKFEMCKLVGLYDSIPMK